MTDELTKAELLQMVANQARTIQWLHNELKEMVGSINNQAPDLMLRKLTLILEKFG
jgi:hypothetical protein